MYISTFMKNLNEKYSNIINQNNRIKEKNEELIKYNEEIFNKYNNAISTCVKLSAENTKKKYIIDVYKIKIRTLKALLSVSMVIIIFLLFFGK